MDSTLDEETCQIGIKEFMSDLLKSQSHTKMDTDVHQTVEYLWTSHATLGIVNHMEFCSILNAVIRDDVAAEIEAAVMIFRSLNLLRVHRADTSVTVSDQTYPPAGETWRGTSFRPRFRPFFERMLHRKYRVPGYLSTSSKQSVAAGFVLKAIKADKNHPCAIWRIMFDSRAEIDPAYLVQHMSFVRNSLCPAEHEYLFVPYSVFTLISVEWSEEMCEPHEFVIQAAHDNRREDEDLPLTPWY